MAIFSGFSEGKELKMRKEIEKVDESAKLEKISKEKPLNKRRKVRSLSWWLEKILIPALVPIVLGFMTYYVQQVSNKLSSSQHHALIQQSNANKQLKYIELFYKDISNTSDPRRQKVALSLLYVIEPEVGILFARAVQLNRENSKEVRMAAEEIGKDIEQLGPLLNYKVYIYYQKGQTNMQNYAEKLKNGLAKSRYRNVQILEKDKDFYARVKPPKGYEIRFDEQNESEAAFYLNNLLKQVDPKAEFNMVRAIVGLTPYLLTVFLPINDDLEKSP